MTAEDPTIRRWWSDAGSTEWVDGNGFSYDDEWFDLYARGARFSLDALDDIPCVVLLGEGGSGKSTELRRWSKGTPNSMTILGRALTNPQRPFQQVREKPDFVAWSRGERPLVLWIDGLDESPLTAVALLQSLRDELSGYTSRVPHLSVRIACRSTAWTGECEKELSDLWRAEQRRSITIRPLSRRDVCAYFEQQGIEGAKAKLDNLVQRGLGASLSRPLLLKDAVESLRGRDAVDVVSLRRHGVQRQLETQRQQNRHDERERLLAAAHWIAALFVLHRMPLDQVRRNASELSATIRIRSDQRHRFVDVSATTIEELFRGSLLFDRAENSLGWAHQSWAEFLCAEWIAALDRTANDKCALLAQEDGSLDVVPETIDATLSYLAMIDASARAVLIARSPFSLLRSDGTTFDDEMRRAVLNGVFALARRLPARVREFGTSLLIERFVNGACDEQLATALLDRSRSDDERWVALWGNATTPLQHRAALRVALDRSEHEYLRVNAAERVSEWGDRELRAQLRPLLEEPTVAEGRLAFAALDGLWRKKRGDTSEISFAQLVATIDRLGGAARVIGSSHARVVSTLEDAELSALLARSATESRALALFSAHRLLDEVIRRGLSPFWIERLLDILLGEDATAAAILRQNLAASIPQRAEMETFSMSLLSAAAARRARTGQPIRWWDVEPFHQHVSLRWLLNHCTDDEHADIWCELAVARFSALVQSENPSIVSDAAEQMLVAREKVNRLREQTRAWFEGMSSEDVSPSQLEFVREDAKRAREAQARSERFEAQRAAWMRNIREPESYWRLVVSSFSDEDGHAVLDGEGVVGTRWWIGLDDTQKATVLDASVEYLRQSETFADGWYLQSKIDDRALAGRIALELLTHHSRSVDATAFAKWSVVILQDWGESSRGSTREALVQRAAEAAPHELGQRAIEMVRHAIEAGERVHVARVIEHVRLDAVLDALPELLQRVSSPGSVVDVFDYWTRWRSDAAIAFARDSLRSIDAPTPLQVGLVASLVSTPSDAAWEVAADAFAQSKPLFEAVIEANLRLEGGTNESWMGTLSTTAIAKLWRVWLSRFRARPLVADGEVHTISPAQGLWDDMNRALGTRAGSDPHALDVMRELALLPNAPEWLKSATEYGAVEQRARRWVARKLDSLRAMIEVRDDAPSSPSNQRPVQHAKDTMKRLFTWVHLSDIHFGHGKRDATVAFDQAMVTRALPEHIGSCIARHTLSIDAVLVTGDVAFSGEPSEYEQARPWFDEVIKRAKIDAQHVFLIPGNHDVNAVRDTFPVGAFVSRLREHTQPFEFATAWNDADAMKLLVERQSAFWKFAEGYAPVLRQGSPFKGWWTAEWTLNDRRLLLVGANTALLSEKRDEPKKLAMGQGQLDEIHQATIGADWVLLLTHHPFAKDWLFDEGRLRPSLNGRVTVHLSGHVHDAQVSMQQSTNGQTWRDVAAGAVHQDGRATSHQYSICSIIERDARRWLQIWPFLWSSKTQRFEHDTSLLNEAAQLPGELDLGPC